MQGMQVKETPQAQTGKHPGGKASSTTRAGALPVVRAHGPQETKEGKKNPTPGSGEPFRSSAPHLHQ